MNWSGASKKTKSFLITLYDPHRPPQSGWWHWLVYDIPASSASLQKNAGVLHGKLPAGAKQALPDGEVPKARYNGPCPHKGEAPHKYVFTLYALDVDHLEVPPTATAADVDYTASAHVVARTSIVRTYGR